jgi:RNA polymerase sigma factor (sigma-70 family)
MRVLIADDHPLFRDGLRGLLEARGMAVVGEATNGREAVEQARRLRPDVLLMDLNMPEMNGLAATRLLSTEQPEVNGDPDASEEDADLFEAIKTGAQALTEREHDVLELLVQGVTSNRDLAERLVISENTVKYHLRNILDKLHVQNRAQVVAYAVRHGMIDTGH